MNFGELLDQLYDVENKLYHMNLHATKMGFGTFKDDEEEVELWPDMASEHSDDDYPMRPPPPGMPPPGTALEGGPLGPPLDFRKQGWSPYEEALAKYQRGFLSAEEFEELTGIPVINLNDKELQKYRPDYGVDPKPKSFRKCYACDHREKVQKAQKEKEEQQQVRPSIESLFL